MASLRLFIAGASAVGAGTLTSYFLLSDTTVSTQSNSHNAFKDPTEVPHERSLIVHLLLCYVM